MTRDLEQLRAAMPPNISSSVLDYVDALERELIAKRFELAQSQALIETLEQVLHATAQLRERA